MNRQLTIYDDLSRSDSESVSLQNERSDALLNESLMGETPKTALVRKQQAIQRYLNQGKSDPTICVNQYSPGRRAAQYYRLSYEWHGKKKHIHLKGGNTQSQLANYRAEKLRELIDRGADLEEVLAMVAMFNGA